MLPLPRYSDNPRIPTPPAHPLWEAWRGRKCGPCQHTPITPRIPTPSADPLQESWRGSAEG
eukprot:11203622-Lingulodinium_polyedra.AAC.1